MPSKAKSQKHSTKKTESVVLTSEPDVETVPEQVPEPVVVVEQTKQRKEKSKSKSKKVVEPVVEQVSEVEEELLTVEDHLEPVEQEVTESSSTTKKRAVRARVVPPTKDTVVDECNVMLTMIADEIKSIKDGSRKGTGVQFLNSLSRKLKSHTTNVSRVTKKRQVTKRVSSVNSGFLKPVQVSREVSEFAGWKNSELHSRTEVTKCVCEYIKSHNLQNPENRRLILPDKKLAALLSYDPSSGEVVRYCDIQRMLKNHFSNPSA